MTVARASTSRREQRSPKRHAKIARRVAAVAGAAGAAATGQAIAEGITYVPTAGVVAAQGIPGFSFTPPTTVTSGTFRSPASLGDSGWDIDGNGQVDFDLRHLLTTSGGGAANLQPLDPFPANPNGLVVTGGSAQSLRNLPDAANVGPAATWWNLGQMLTYGGVENQAEFTPDQPGYFGFRFAFGNNPNNYYYGWASLTIDFAAEGQGYKITEAFYQSTPNTGIQVGAVPVPVPEPSSMALLAAGAAGVTAWRVRKKKQQPATE